MNFIYRIIIKLRRRNFLPWSENFNTIVDIQFTSLQFFCLQCAYQCGMVFKT